MDGLNGVGARFGPSDGRQGDNVTVESEAERFADGDGNADLCLLIASCVAFGRDPTELEDARDLSLVDALARSIGVLLTRPPGDVASRRPARQRRVDNASR